MRCPRCDSPSQRLHPAVQAEGEVQPCPHDWHYTVRDGRCDAHKRLVPCSECSDARRFAVAS